VAITVPTGELVRILTDTLPFVHPDPELPNLNAVRIEWDATMLHALTTDKVRAAHSSWHPHDDPDGDAQDPMGVSWGGADDAWACIISAPDAKDIVKTFKLGAKETRTPVTVDFDRGRLIVFRSPQTGHSEHRMAVKEQLVDHPDVRDMIDGPEDAEPAYGVEYCASFIADFKLVQPRGGLKLQFTKGFTRVEIGDRFVGGLIPTRIERKRGGPQVEQASDGDL
jgi:hypothetical protein